jgi:hypothetical protein
MIIPAKSQFNWLSGFQQEDFFNSDQSEHIMASMNCFNSNMHSDKNTIVHFKKDSNL